MKYGKKIYILFFITSTFSHAQSQSLQEKVTFIKPYEYIQKIGTQVTSEETEEEVDVKFSQKNLAFTYRELDHKNASTNPGLNEQLKKQNQCYKKQSKILDDFLIAEKNQNRDWLKELGVQKISIGLVDETTPELKESYRKTKEIIDRFAKNTMSEYSDMDENVMSGQAGSYTAQLLQSFSNQKISEKLSFSQPRYDLAQIALGFQEENSLDEIQNLFSNDPINRSIKTNINSFGPSIITDQGYSIHPYKNSGFLEFNERVYASSSNSSIDESLLLFSDFEQLALRKDSFQSDAGAILFSPQASQAQYKIWNAHNQLNDIQDQNEYNRVLGGTLSQLSKDLKEITSNIENTLFIRSEIDQNGNCLVFSAERLFDLFKKGYESLLKMKDTDQAVYSFQQTQKLIKNIKEEKKFDHTLDNGSTSSQSL